MKKITISAVAFIMGFCFVALLYLQVTYINTLVDIRKEYFYEGARRSLNQVAHRLELDEVQKYLTEDNSGYIKKGSFVGGNSMVVRSYTTSTNNGGVVSTITVNTSVPKNHHHLDEDFFIKDLSKALTVEEAQRLQHDVLKMRAKYQRDVLDEVIFHMLDNARTTPLQKRIENFESLERYIAAELRDNGVDMPFGIRLLDHNGRDTVYCSVKEECGKVIEQPLFANASPSRAAMLELCFPQSALNKFIYGSVKFMLPSLLFTFVLLITFVFTLYLAVRHKRITKMKNDFINNMTHEFKTPISAISLAAQMLQDESVSKSPEMFQRLSGVISSETKRLRFQVDKVLQMSMFDDKNTAALNMKELDANELISGIANTFAVKVNQGGGSIKTILDATDPYISADEMHFTNVVFNLLDNAVKYRRQEVPIELEVHTWNAGGKFMMSVKDNGIGMKKEHLKKIFERFYRVHTGNVHNVKGFGLGLAYVKQIVRAHRGTIHAESESGVGTTFVIVLPLK
ncbi:MAG: HAMP domain-containing histidine kinase [Bacteroidaceae bacterium]|nr:HAMP domain-containing histidine kinase [Bacteroidaceae bacterium]